MLEIAAVEETVEMGVLWCNDPSCNYNTHYQSTRSWQRVGRWTDHDQGALSAIQTLIHGSDSRVPLLHSHDPLFKGNVWRDQPAFNQLHQ